MKIITIVDNLRELAKSNTEFQEIKNMPKFYAGNKQI